MRLKTLFTLCLLLVALTAYGQATNSLRLEWTPPPYDGIPYYFEVLQTTNPYLTNWIVVRSNIPSETPYHPVVVDVAFKAWKVRCVNATNSVYKSDFSNVATTAWPGRGNNLKIVKGT